MPTIGSETISDNLKPFKNDEKVVFYLKALFVLNIFVLTFRFIEQRPY